MGKLQEFLMENKRDMDETAEIKVTGFPFPFVVKPITLEQNEALSKMSTKVTFDKKTHQRSEHLDQSMYMKRLVSACCVDPNFRDAELQATRGVTSAEELIGKVLTNGQFSELIDGVLSVNDFVFESTNDLIEEAKN